jgi:serine/threonine protein phosphatase 1
MGVFAIGDLHGCPDELEVLLARLGAGAGDTLVFLGDYVDRGPRVRTLVERLLRLRAEQPATVFLRGNHEDMLLAYLGLRGRHGDVYVANGGGATLASYGVAPGTEGAAAAASFPADHLEFFQGLLLTHRYDRFLFVHAGVRPGVALEQQDEEDLLWIREEFFAVRHDLPWTVVFGHTPQREVRMALPFHLGLDTGLVYGNKLSCLDIDARRLLQVARGARRVVERDLDAEFTAANL